LVLSSDVSPLHRMSDFPADHQTRFASTLQSPLPESTHLIIQVEHRAGRGPRIGTLRGGIRSAGLRGGAWCRASSGGPAWEGEGPALSGGCVPWSVEAPRAAKGGYRGEPHTEALPSMARARVFAVPAVELVRSGCAPSCAAPAQHRLEYQGGAAPRRLNGRDFGREDRGTEKVACGAADEPPASGGVDGAVAPGNGSSRGARRPPSAVFA